MATETLGKTQAEPIRRSCTSKQEVIHIQVGKSGNAIGHAFWKDLCGEHRIDYAGGEDLAGTFRGESPIYEDRAHVFFNEGSVVRGKVRYVPRCILVDTSMQDLGRLCNSDLGGLYRPENVIGNDEGCANCYAKAFHTEGPDLAERCLELVRKEVERCNCLQGVQFVHSIIGGTGSGLTGLLLKTLGDYLDKSQSKCIMQCFTLFPSPTGSDNNIEPYNAALGIQDLLEYSDQVFALDNGALNDICKRALSLENKDVSLERINTIVAMCMSGITSCLRFSGKLNADLRNMRNNLVPFKYTHFLMTSLAPLTSDTAKKYRQTSVLDLIQQAFSKDNVTLKVDPLNPGDKYNKVLPSRFLAGWGSWRGDFKTKAVDQVHFDIQKKGSRYDSFFPDWIPNSIASNICSVPHPLLDDSLVMTSNNTSVHTVFDRIVANWDSLYSKKAFVGRYEVEGISRDDLMESRNIVQYISDQYTEYARWEDSFFEPLQAGGKPVINEKAIKSDEQHKIAQELSLLGEGSSCGSMYIAQILNKRG